MTAEESIRRKRGPSRIPEFHSIQEEAEFWDTHDTTDFEDEFKPVKVRFAKNLSEGITIRLDPETLVPSAQSPRAAPHEQREAGSPSPCRPLVPRTSERLSDCA